MSTSSRSFGIDFAKNLYDSIRSDSNNLMLFLGGDTAANNQQNTVDDDNDVWDNINFLKKVKESDLSVVAKRVDWNSGSVYYPYTSAGVPTGATGTERNYYAMTDDREVFLCMSADENNRSDLFGKSTSTVKPTRSNDNTVLSDGYRWKFLYKLDLSHTKFLTTNYMPVVDIDDYDETSGSSSIQEEAFRSGCGLSAGMTGSCCFYYNEDSIDPLTNIVYKRGDLDFCVDDIQCSKCFLYSKNLDKSYNFTRFGTCDNNTCASSKIVKRGYELLLSNSKKISPSRGNILQASVYKDAVDNAGQIQSVSVNLQGLTETELTTTTESPIVNLTSSTGTGGDIRLKTRTAGISFGVQQYVVTGVDLVSAGSGYKDVAITSVSPDVSDKIKINLDYFEGLGSNPRRALNATKFMIAVAIRSDKLPTEAGTDQNVFTRYGLIRDVLVKASTASGLTSAYLAGSDKNRDEEQILSNVTKISLAQNVARGFTFSGSNITFEKGSPITNTTNLSSSRLSSVSSTIKESGKTGKIVNAKATTKLSLTNGADLEVIGAADDIFKVGDTLVPNNATDVPYTISSVTKPDVQAFTGKVVASNTTNVTLTTQPRELMFRYVYSLGKY